MLLGLGGPVVTSRKGNICVRLFVNSEERLTGLAAKRGKRRTDDVLKRHVGEGGYLPLCWMAWRSRRKHSESTHDLKGKSASPEELNPLLPVFSNWRRAAAGNGAQTGAGGWIIQLPGVNIFDITSSFLLKKLTSDISPTCAKA